MHLDAEAGIVSKSILPAQQQVQPSQAAAERRSVLLFALIMMLITTIPYIIGYSAQGDDYRFSEFVFGVEDGNSYIAKMLNGWSGSLLFRSPYTAFPQAGLFLYLPYLLLGKLVSPPALHEQQVALFHLFRIAAGILFICSSYDFTARFIEDRRLRYLSLGLICLGGGLGWIFVLSGCSTWLGSLPLEFYSPEAFGFLSLFGLPHLAVGRALMLWALLAYLDLVKAAAFQSNDLRSIRRSAVKLFSFMAAGRFFNPLSLAVIGAVILIHWIGLAVYETFRKPQGAVGWTKSRQIAAWLVAAGALPGLFLAYNFRVSLYDPYAREWTAQNIIRSPHFAHYLLAYGLLIPFAWFGARGLMKRDPLLTWLPLGWVLAFPLLAYAPLELQRRLTEGVWAAWCVLAVSGLDKPEFTDFPFNLKSAVRWSPLLLAFPSAFFLIAGGILAAARPAPPLFLPTDQAASYLHLQESALPGSVVLASFSTGNSLPAWAPVSVVIGHGPESIRLSEVKPQVEAFYNRNTSDESRLALIERFNIQFVLSGAG